MRNKPNQTKKITRIILIVAGIMAVIGLLAWGAYAYFSTEKDANPDELQTTSIDESKYEGIDVKTIERRENDGRSNMSVSYPVTDNKAINQTAESFSREFIKSFEETAQSQEQLYQNAITDDGEEPVSTVTDFTQHFDVSFASEHYLSFVFDRYKNTGGTGANTTLTKLFDRNSGEEIALRQLFDDENYLDKLSEVSREILYERVEQQADELDGSEQALAEYTKSSKEAIDAGTEPTEENFDSVTIDDDSNKLIIYFDKYQVSSGSDGVVEVEIPLKRVADILIPQLRDLFAIESSEPENPPQDNEQSTPGTDSQTKDSATNSTDCAALKCIALTFDDGPSVYTDTLLNTLKEHKVPATFFVLGRSAKIQPDTVRRIVNEGHELGNHTWDHKDLRTLPGEAIDTQLRRTDTLIESIAGVTPKYLRPPYGSYNKTVLSHVDRPIILWSVDPKDWEQPSQAELVRRMTTVQPGAIILAHDIHQNTVAVVPQVIRTLKDKGFHFVTTSNLLGEDLQPGTAYSQR